MTLENDPRAICMAVGMAISTWEAMELQLAKLYSLFVGKPGDIETIVSFGDRGGTFTRRLPTLETAAAAYFVKRSSQADEGDFLDLVRRAEQMSDERKRIAHGICWETRAILDTPGLQLGPPSHQWVSPLYSIGLLSVPKDYRGFQYSAADINRINAQFNQLREDVTRYALRLLPPTSPQTQPAQ